MGNVIPTTTEASSYTSFEYQVYREEVLQYLSTVSIKFSAFATFTKKQVLDKYGEVIESDEVNPYYLHLCGQYSKYDTPMYVTTVETNERVLFDTNLVKNYPKTAAFYRVPSKEYSTLMTQYPTQTSLIRAIVYPAKDLETVLSAPDITLLAHDETLLHQNERATIIVAIETFLDYVGERWYMADFDFEDLYPALWYAQLFQHLPNVIFLQRLKNLHTPAVHPTHVWEFLFSNGLSDYRDVLSDTQASFLYRNLLYLYKNKGKTSNLKILAENLIDTLYVSLNGKTLFQNILLKPQDCETVPQVINENISLRHTNKAIEKDFSTEEAIEGIMRRMHATGLETDITNRNIAKTEDLFSTSIINYLPSKLLEFKKHMMDSRALNLILNYLTETLFYKYSKDRLSFDFSFIVTSTNTRIYLTAGEALALFNYAACRSIGYTPVYLPTKAQIHTSYRENKPETLPNIYHWLRDHGNYPIRDVLDIDKMIKDVDWSTDSFKTTKEFFDFLIHNLITLLTEIASLDSNGDLRYHDAMKYIYREYFLLTTTCEFTLVPGYTKYEDWMKTVYNGRLADIIENFDSDQDQIARYKELYWQLCTYLFPVEDARLAKLFAGARDDTTYYNTLKNFFISMGGYTVAYLDTVRDSIEYVFAPTPCVGLVDTKYKTATTVDVMDTIQATTSPKERIVQSIDVTIPDYNDTLVRNVVKEYACIAFPFIDGYIISETVQQLALSGITYTDSLDTDVTKPLQSGNYLRPKHQA